MPRSRSLALGVMLSIVSGLLTWLLVRAIRERTAQQVPQRTRRNAQPQPAPAAISELVPAHVYTDAEPTAIEAALREALTAEEAQATDIAPTEMRWVGNTRTLVLHRADSSYLPSEEHRQYFQSEEEALAAGYRLAANE
jgi:hypothetical protein